MEVLLSDASALLNLLAAERLAVIAQVSGWQFAICPAVRDEVKKLRDPQTGEMAPVDIAPLIDTGLLRVLELAGDAELALYVEQAAVVDDGEAMSIAIAANRGLTLAIDDKQAVNHTRRTFPNLRLWSTPEILKHWAEAGNVEASMLREAIQLIEARARYFPHKLHPLAQWWQMMRQPENPPDSERNAPPS
jgi:predicted nucleic acid-binding protein